MISSRPVSPDALFANILSQPLHHPLGWKRGETAGKSELSLAGGVRMDDASVPFPANHLDTALDDFRTFLTCQSIAVDEGIPIRFERLSGEATGRYGVEIAENAVTISSDGADGIRRGLVWMEDEMQGRGGPFLPLGKWERRAVISTRISRCFYGPIQRPPFNRNELADEVNYYPDAYLNRLAHDGVTALWITIKFSVSVPSRLFPEFGQEAEKHLGKLQATVKQCARYGIKVYAFCIEPAAFAYDSPIFAQHPELRGARSGSLVAFCTQSHLGHQYVEEATATLFEKVPGLGGLIVIPVGERFTNCASSFLRDLESCPRCSKAGRHKVLHDVLEGFRKGMSKAAPEAELIAWPYGQMVCWGADNMVEAASHMPPGVILQHNYETGGVAWQLGKPRPLWDYWLSWTGVSPVFEGAARFTLARNGRIGAKLQVGNSHEDATVPFLPVPGLIYRKYKALHRLGVSAAMQSWYFGNYPSLMTRAAGLLSYAPLPKTEKEFLHQLARKEWGSQAGLVAKAWACFGRGYSNYPATHFFSYYGPVQNGVTWPLYLKPRRLPLSPTWKIDFSPSGDYLPHCFSHYFTLRELVTLCTRMVRDWKLGCSYLENAYSASARTATQTHEWRIAEAVRIQFENALAILQFYSLREQLVEEKGRANRLDILDKMAAIVCEEIQRRREFIPLLRQEPTLGYHSEAEGFKITVDVVESGIEHLQMLLKKEFPEVRKHAGAREEDWFGEYTGCNPGATPWLALHRRSVSEPDSTAWDAATRHPMRYWLFEGSKEAGTHDIGKRGTPSLVLPVTAHFQMLAGLGNFYFSINLSTEKAGIGNWAPSVVIEIEPTRMQPRVKFVLEASGACCGYYEEGYIQPNPTFFGCWQPTEKGKMATVEIPTARMALPRRPKPFRMNVRLLFENQETGECRELSWIQRKPMRPRLAWGDINPATDYGWVLPATVASRLPKP